ncbi:MAG TPA: rhomboid family intramembrane serine protease [Bacteroidia bacterium]|nr:rhomboid family intramembrane serine protease [Bacteroidia bacterium]
MSYEQYRPQKFQILPPVVKNLLIINGLMFLLTLVLQNRFGIDLNDKLGLHYFSNPKFRPYQIVTYMFMHGGWAHIFFNMFALWMFGNMLENYWGGKRFLIFYMICGIGAALVQQAVATGEFYYLQNIISNYALSPDPNAFYAIVSKHFSEYKNDPAILNLFNNGDHFSNFKGQSLIFLNQLLGLRKDIDVIGASGAIFGVLLAFGMLFPNTLLYVYFIMPVKAKYFVIFYGALELYSGIANNPGDNVAHFAHLGGMLFGFILIKYWQKNSNNFY